MHLSLIIVTSAGYELTVQRLDGLATAVADVKIHTFVLEEGTYSLGNDGAKMEVGKVDLVDSSSAWNGFTFGSEVTPQQSYVNPVVIGQMQTSFSDHWVQFWSRGASANEPFKAGDTELTIGHHTGEDPDTWVPFVESAGYLIIEAGRGTLKGIPYEAGLSPKLGAVSADDSFEITASGTMQAVAKTLLSIEGMQNEDGGLPVLRNTTVSKITVKIDEDKLADDEREHGREAVGWLMLGQ